MKSCARCHGCDQRRNHGVPFVRTVGEAKQVVELLAKTPSAWAENGLRPDHIGELRRTRCWARNPSTTVSPSAPTTDCSDAGRSAIPGRPTCDERKRAVKKAAVRWPFRPVSLKLSDLRAGLGFTRIWHAGLMQQGIKKRQLNPDSVMDTWFFRVWKTTWREN